MKRVLLLLACCVAFGGCASSSHDTHGNVADNMDDPDRVIWRQNASGNEGYQF